ncbi:MAG: EamA family transporter [Verrucomicrobia bacterium]|nr:EamA family transporter [Verrucomicrobiota bacterium]
MFGALLATILFSLSAVTAARTAKLMGGTEANFWRLALAALFLAIYARVFGDGLVGSSFHIFLLSGCVGFGLGDVSFFQALPRIGTRLSVLMVNCLAAPVAALTEWLWLGTTLSTVEIVCAGIILAGVAVALAPGEHLHIEARKFWPGLLAGFLAACGQGWGAVLSRKAFDVARIAGEDISGLAASYQRIIGGVIIAGICLLVVKRGWLLAHGRSAISDDEIDLPDSREKWRMAWPWLVMNSLAGPTFGVSCFQLALKTTATGVVLPIVALTPLVVIPFTAWMEGEKPTRRSLAGGALAVAGAVALAVARH